MHPGWAKPAASCHPRRSTHFSVSLRQPISRQAKATPSVFLTDRGGIELVWEDRNGKSVQVEFTGTGAEFYEAATDEEACSGV